MTHANDECTGGWRLILDKKTIQCDTCMVTYPATEANRRAAVDEYLAGVWLRRLAAEGAKP